MPLFVSVLLLLPLWKFKLFYCLDFKKQVLDVHNEFRSVHGVPPMVLDDELSKKADKLAYEAMENGMLDKAHSGENTYMICSTYSRPVTPKEVVEAWYDEVCTKGFSFSNPNNDKAYAFTQLIWKDSVKLGVGKSVTHTIGTDDMKCTFAIALYRPPGNIELKGTPEIDRQFKENVLLGSFKTSYCDKFKDNDKRQVDDSNYNRPEDA